MALEGTQLGRYRLRRLLGSGGMGEVYLADDSTLNRQVAIKVIRADPSPYPDSDTAQEAAKLFQREARAIAMLDHPHILPLYDYGEERGDSADLTYLVMPYRPQGTLNNWLRQHSSGPLSPAQVVQLIQQAASALQYAHNHGLIHQDVKPTNFLMRANGEEQEHGQQADLQLADFGIARLLSSTSSSTHGSRGTPLYMAPEQWTGNAVQASDQYALAIMTYELLTGTLPFQGGLAQVMYAHMHTPPPPPSSLNPHLPRAFDYVLLRALAKDPQERYASVSDFARALQYATTATTAATAIGVAQTIPSSTQMSMESHQAAAQTYISQTYAAPPFRPYKATQHRAILLIALALIVAVSGGLGVFYFTRSSTTLLTLHGTEVATANTSNALGNPYPPNAGTLVLNDTLYDSTHSSWREESDTFGACQFIQGAYHVTMSLQGLEYCFSNSAGVSDFAYQVQLVILKGSSAGVIVRGNPDTKSFYYCYIGPDGSYGINVYSSQSDSPTARLSAGISKAIHQGGGQSNTLAVVARGNTLELYVNMQRITSVTTSTYSSGNVGVAVYSVLSANGSGSTEAVFSNAKVWKL